MHQTQPVAVRLKAHGFGINGDDGAKGQAVGQVVLVEVDGQGEGEIFWGSNRISPAARKGQRPWPGQGETWRQAAGQSDGRPPGSKVAAEPFGWAIEKIANICKTENV